MEKKVWIRQPGGAVKVVPSHGKPTFWLPGTSTSTVNLREHDASLGDALRMFALPTLPKTVWPATDPPGTLPGDDPAAERLLFFDSVLDGGGRPAFVLYEPTAGTSPLKSTVIPARRTSKSWTYMSVSYGGTAPAGHSDPTEFSALSSTWGTRQMVTFDVSYKDPGIVHLPDGKGWLMLLSRVRRLSSDHGPDNGPNGGLSDIVAYWADEADPGFEDASSVTGPYWIAPNIGALGHGTSGIQFWLSVPTGAMLSSRTLAVYFVVEATRYLQVAKSTDVTKTYAGIAYLDRRDTPVFESCIGVHLLDLADLAAQRTAGHFGSEADWEIGPFSKKFALPRTAGPLYVWERDSSGRPSTELVDRSQIIKLADPAVARCSLNPRTIGGLLHLRLFHSVIGRGKDWTKADDIHGLWMARPLVTGAATVTRKDGSIGPTAAGFDWLLSDTLPFEAAEYDVPSFDDPDKLVAFALPLDPDPVRLGDGSWRLYWGLQEQFADRTPPPPIVLMEDRSTSSVVCADNVRYAQPFPAAEPPLSPRQFAHMVHGFGMQMACGVRGDPR